MIVAIVRLQNNNDHAKQQQFNLIQHLMSHFFLANLMDKAILIYTFSITSNYEYISKAAHAIEEAQYLAIRLIDSDLKYYDTLDDIQNIYYKRGKQVIINGICRGTKNYINGFDKLKLRDTQILAIGSKFRSNYYKVNHNTV